MADAWREIDDQIFVRRHASYDLNVGLVVGDGGCLVIDTRESVVAGTELAVAVREVTDQPWTVLTTHAHHDHFLGNSAFAPTRIWSSGRCREVILEYGEVQRRIWAEMQRRDGHAAAAEQIEASSVVAATHTFETARHELPIGERSVWLHQLGRGHTDNDVVVTVTGSSVVFAGDLVEEGAPPGFGDSYPLDWATTLDGVLGLVSDSGAVVRATATSSMPTSSVPSMSSTSAWRRPRVMRALRRCRDCLPRWPKWRSRAPGPSSTGRCGRRRRTRSSLNSV